MIHSRTAVADWSQDSAAAADSAPSPSTAAVPGLQQGAFGRRGTGARTGTTPAAASIAGAAAAGNAQRRYEPERRPFVRHDYPESSARSLGRNQRPPSRGAVIVLLRWRIDIVGVGNRAPGPVGLLPEDVHPFADGVDQRARSCQERSARRSHTHSRSPRIRKPRPSSSPS